jgi:hypothetical protein
LPVKERTFKSIPHLPMTEAPAALEREHQRLSEPFRQICGALIPFQECTGGRTSVERLAGFWRSQRPILAEVTC